MGPDVAQPGRAEEGVGHGMGHDVGVAVPAQAPLPGEDDAAQHQHPFGVVAPGMDVEALPDPDVHRDRRVRAARPDEVVGTGDLEVGGVAVDDHHAAAGRLHEGGVVGGVAAALVGPAQDAAEKACGVWIARRAGRSSVSTTWPVAGSTR